MCKVRINKMKKRQRRGNSKIKPTTKIIKYLHQRKFKKWNCCLQLANEMRTFENEQKQIEF